MIILTKNKLKPMGDRIMSHRMWTQTMSGQTWNQVRDQVWDRIWNQIVSQIYDNYNQK
jgi:hypothetical protein